MEPIIDSISRKIADDFSDIEKKAKNLLHILVCGSYKTPEDLGVIKGFRDRQKVKGIFGVFLMKDFKIVDDQGNEMKMPLHEKMHLIWKRMKEGDNIPLFILFAGESAGSSTGLNAEIQTISCDKEKTSCAYLFKFPNINLVSHEKCFANVQEVKDEDDFIEKAEIIIDAFLNQAKMFYQAGEEKK